MKSDDIFFVYALFNINFKRIYVGLSSNVDKRLKYHNSKKVFSTKAFVPWILFYKECCGNRKLAREREKYLKSGIGKEYLKGILKYTN